MFIFVKTQHLLILSVMDRNDPSIAFGLNEGAVIDLFRS